MQIKVRFEPGLSIGPPGNENGAELLLRLLQAIRRSGSIAEAARAMGCSYRYAWGIVNKWGEILDQPLAQLERGRGAQLTPLGERLLWADQQARERLGPVLAELVAEIECELTKVHDTKRKPLVVYASHDLALVKLRDSSEREGMKLDMQFHGSRDSLVAFSRGECDLAGFHVSERESAPELARLLKPGAHKLIGLAHREQGLIVLMGNPKHIRHVRDLTRPGIRFVNRQRNSGTRLAFDHMIELAGIAPGSILGYKDEEFTHLAVAATVAGGKADVGFGIQAAAAQYGLGFVPLVSERYLLACSGERIEEPQVREFIALLRSDLFKQIVSELPGYHAAIAGKIMDVDEGLAGPSPVGRNG